MGLKMATNLFLRMPSCVNFKGTKYYSHHYDRPSKTHAEHLQAITSGMFTVSSWPLILIEYCPVSSEVFYQRFGVGSAPSADAGPPPPIQTARSFFPETWIWDLVEVGWAFITSLFTSCYLSAQTLNQNTADLFHAIKKLTTDKQQQRGQIALYWQTTAMKLQFIISCLLCFSYTLKTFYAVYTD